MLNFIVTSLLLRPLKPSALSSSATFLHHSLLSLAHPPSRLSFFYSPAIAKMATATTTTTATLPPVHPSRLQALNRISFPNRSFQKQSYILYWMSRSLRTRHNPTFQHAIHIAQTHKLPLLTIYILDGTQPYLTIRHYSFIYHSLLDIHNTFHQHNLPFLILKGRTVQLIKTLSQKAITIVTDCSYLRWGRNVRNEIACNVKIPMIQVEGDVVVPVKVVSDKQEYAARTIRPKIHKVMDEFLGRDRLDEIEDMIVKNIGVSNWMERLDGMKILKELGLEGMMIDLDKGWEVFEKSLDIDRVPRIVQGCFKGGQVEGEKVLNVFLEKKLKWYADERNEPAKDMQSDLSPYLRFGNLSPVCIVRRALEAAKNKGKTGIGSFVEELVVRRELAVNFVYYAADIYDSFEVLPEFAKKTLKDHEGDERKCTYSYEQLEAACTYDEYWNAAQLEMVVRGKMHGYMRMYWAKKILEWTKKPHVALSHALRLNNRWELDGEDPNSYAGVLWSFGLHDHGWSEREIFGKVRYMNYNGLKRKFNMQGYAAKVRQLVRKYGLPSELETLRKKKKGQPRILDFLSNGQSGARKRRKTT